MRRGMPVQRIRPTCCTYKIIISSRISPPFTVSLSLSLHLSPSSLSFLPHLSPQVAGQRRHGAKLSLQAISRAFYQSWQRDMKSGQRPTERCERETGRERDAWAPLVVGALVPGGLLLIARETFLIWNSLFRTVIEKCLCLCL